MKIIEPNVTKVTDFEGVDNFYKAVARAARICYASDKTTDDKELCKRLIEKKHYSPFAHAVVYIRTESAHRNFEILNNIFHNNKFTIPYNSHTFFAVNGRVIVEEIEKWIGNLELSSSIFEYLETFLLNIKTIESPLSGYFKSFIVDTSIGCTREMNRHHDNFYICEQSTRYCNFSKDKFENKVAFNKPYWYDTKNSVYKAYWTAAMENAEMLYMTAIKDIPEDLKNCSDNEFGMGFHIDEARGILPLDTHTRAIYTATIEEWKHIIDLRLEGIAGKPHGDIMIIASKINELL